MCGITLSIYPVSHGEEERQQQQSQILAIHDSLAENNSSRGPDTSSNYVQQVEVVGGKVEIRLTSSVLGLRGDLTAQPLVGERGVLAWNGQVFNGMKVDENENDTRAVFRQLEAGMDIHELLAQIEGPFAFVYYEFETRTLTYQLDLLSRRALLQHIPTVTASSGSPSSTTSSTNLFCLSSTRSSEARQAGLSFRALGGGEGGMLSLNDVRIVEGGQLDVSQALIPRDTPLVESPYTRIPALNHTLPLPDYIPSADAAIAELPRFMQELEKSVRRRVVNIPPPTAGAALLFSGGVDSALMACMLHRYLPPNEPIDLINVAFQRSPDGPTENDPRQKAKIERAKAKAEIKQRQRLRDQMSSGATSPGASGTGSGIQTPIEALPTETVTSNLANLAIQSPEPEESTRPANPESSTPKINGSKLPNGLSKENLDRLVLEQEYNVPDRIAGREAVGELRASCPGREFRFVVVDVTHAEFLAHRPRVLDLMYPCTTEMDLSLALPLYFASRGIGRVDGEPYTVGAKVYFTGLGPDEQLGGYSRHRTAYLNPQPPLSPFPSLLASLTHEVSRLPHRNTSRDDRLLSSHARDARYPYLDLEFIAYLSSLPVWCKAVYELGEGVGDKILVRLAAERCGLKGCSKRVKRAMQFGSRSAKVGGKIKGAKKGEREVEI